MTPPARATASSSDTSEEQTGIMEETAETAATGKPELELVSGPPKPAQEQTGMMEETAETAATGKPELELVSGPPKPAQAAGPVQAADASVAKTWSLAQESAKEAKVKEVKERLE